MHDTCIAFFLDPSGMHNKITNKRKLIKISHNPKNNIYRKISTETCTRSISFIAKNIFLCAARSSKAGQKKDVQSRFKSFKTKNYDYWIIGFAVVWHYGRQRAFLRVSTTNRFWPKALTFCAQRHYGGHQGIGMATALTQPLSQPGLAITGT